MFPNPNTLVLCLLNPFSTFRADTEKGEVFGNSDDTRLGELQALIDQLDDTDYWFDNLSSSFQGQAIRIMQEAFEEFFSSNAHAPIRPEISLPDWGSFKTNMIEAVTCHNMDIRLTGLLRTIYSEYMDHCRQQNMDDIFYSDDLPMFGYQDHQNFLAVWEIMKGLSGDVDNE